MRRTILLSFLISLLFILNGCWDRWEVEDRMPVINMAIDPAFDNEYLVSLSFPNVSLLPGGLNPSPQEATPITISTKSEKISLAMEYLQNQLSTEIFLGYVRVVIINEEIIKKKGLVNILDAVRRSSQIRPLIFTLISPQAQDSIKASPKEEAIPINYISKTLENEKRLGWIPSTYIKDFFITLHNKGIEPVLVYAETTEKRLKIKGLAVFKKDKMVGKLNLDETSDFLRLKSQLGRNIAFECPLHPGEVIVVRPKAVQSKINLAVNETGNLTCTFNLEIWAETVEKDSNRSHKSKKAKDLLHNKLGEIIETRSQKLIKKVQEEFQSDIFGIGLHVKAYYPEVWQTISWEKVFPDIPINIKVRSIITDEKIITTEQ